MKTFIRSVSKDGWVEFSWYNKNGRRYKHESIKPENINDFIKSDNTYGYMAYATENGFKILDDFNGDHPKNLVKQN
jgi:uncharacterized protein YodC (DUF2158 family)